MIGTPESVIEFWFGDDTESPVAVTARARLWFRSDPSFDTLIRERFGVLPERARQGKLDAWRQDARASLALVLVLDQFPRNLYRGTPQCYACDTLACEVADAAIERGFHLELSALEATFLYLPFEHAENVETQTRCVSLFQKLLERAPVDLHAQFQSFLSYAVRHRDVIDRFGRFPHRNAILGRQSTEEELAYLASGGETF